MAGMQIQLLQIVVHWIIVIPLLLGAIAVVSIISLVIYKLRPPK